MRSRSVSYRDDGHFLLWVIVVLLAIILLLVLILAKNEEQILALERRTNVPFLGRLTEDVSKKRSAGLCSADLSKDGSLIRDEGPRTALQACSGSFRHERGGMNYSCNEPNTRLSAVIKAIKFHRGTKCNRFLTAQ